MFNDQKNITCQNIEMKKDLIKKHTYTRWSDYGTFFGVNRYSFVCLTGSLEHLKKPWINAAFLVNHMQTMYYNMSEICIVQSASLLLLSDELD
jgi:cellobiose phosphorylase